MNTISRRAALAGVATLPLASVPASSARSELRSPFRELDTILAADRAAWDAYALADDAATREMRDVPAALLVRPEDEALGIPGAGETFGKLQTPVKYYEGVHINRMQGGNFRVPRVHQLDGGPLTVSWSDASQATKARVNEIAAAFREHQDRLATSPIQEAAKRAGDEADGADEATREAVGAVCSAPALTPAEFEAKLRALAWSVGATTVEEALEDIGSGRYPQGSILASIARDALAMARR